MPDRVSDGSARDSGPAVQVSGTIESWERALGSRRERPQTLPKNGGGSSPSFIVAPDREAQSPTATSIPSPSSVHVRVGGVPTLLPNRAITDPTLLPYPFISPTPAPEPTSIDGTYRRIQNLWPGGIAC